MQHLFRLYTRPNLHYITFVMQLYLQLFLPFSNFSSLRHTLIPSPSKKKIRLVLLWQLSCGSVKSAGLHARTTRSVNCRLRLFFFFFFFFSTATSHTRAAHRVPAARPLFPWERGRCASLAVVSLSLSLSLSPSLSLSLAMEKRDSAAAATTRSWRWWPAIREHLSLYILYTALGITGRVTSMTFRFQFLILWIHSRVDMLLWWLMRLRAGRRERASEGYLLSMFLRRFALLARLCVGRREFLRDDSDKQANGFLDGFYGLRSFFFL